MFLKTKLLLIFIFIFPLWQLQQLFADDNGFRITPSVGLGYSYKYKESLFKPNVDLDFTYLMPIRLEVGVGIGYMHDVLYYNGGTMTLSGVDGSVPFERWRKDSFPIYGVVKYSFDLNETDDIVVAVKYGIMYANKGVSWVNDWTPAGATPQGFDMQNVRFMAVTIGYELDDTMFALDLRATAYNQHFYFGANTFNSKEYNGYFGLAVQQRFNLF